ncbi:hypothetical protein V6N13_035116 [Hibiscus sabdariffa]
MEETIQVGSGSFGAGMAMAATRVQWSGVEQAAAGTGMLGKLGSLGSHKSWRYGICSLRKLETGIFTRGKLETANSIVVASLLEYQEMMKAELCS